MLVPLEAQVPEGLEGITREGVASQAGTKKPDLVLSTMCPSAVKAPTMAGHTGGRVWGSHIITRRANGPVAC